ncbi:MAG TPA: hypothetical protein VFW11_20615 [Cyclobacteriaceae bacterium]|nr:hypothetical protein [Cyclobacteriaceae bacterium]
MSKIVLTIVAIGLSSVAFAQRQAFGLRLGDPIAATYKRYIQSNKAVEFMLGTASPNWRRDYYRKSFYEYDKYEGFTYQSHKLNNPLYLQGRYLFQNHIPVEDMEGRLEWYCGAGAMLKLAKIEYRYKNGPPDNSTNTDVKNTIDFGPEGIVGIEYTFEDVPLNVFGELSVLVELADRPFALQVFGGVGARFIF